MKVKLLSNICGPEGSFKIGQTVELSEKLSKSLIKDGHATEIAKKEENVTESKDKVTESEEIVTESKDKVIESEENVTESKDKVNKNTKKSANKFDEK